ncbi:MAG: restriction endonuclease subunit S [Lachnospiraceae bacterium]|nr:restriction endonuclease subunit S [Lachnospiraceae bacterium]
MGLKNSKAGMIPEEWDVQNFSDTFRILNNNTFSRAELNYASGPFKNIHYGDVLILFPEVLDCTRDDVPFINEEARISGSAQTLQDGDIVMADTAEDETVGKVTEVMNTSRKPVMAGLHTIACRVKSGEFVPKWLGYYMNSHLYHDQLLPYIHGTKVSSVSKGSLGDTAIIVPSPKEQERIVEALFDIDNLITDLSRLIRKKKDIRQGTLQLLVTGKQRLNGFDDEWITQPLEKLCELITDGSHESPAECMDGFYMPSVKDMTDNGFDFTDCKRISKYDYERLLANGCKPEIGDVLIAKDGSMLKYVFPVKENSNIVILSSIAILRPKKNILNSSYLTYYFRQPRFVEHVINSNQTGTGVPRIVLKNFKKIELHIPRDSKEQKAIADILADMDVEIWSLEKKVKKAAAVKQGMMEELLTGKVRLV